MIDEVLAGSRPWWIETAEVRAGIALMPDECVQAVVTSPPFWKLRRYGVEGEIGWEPTPDAFVAVLVEVFRGVRRVLRRDGVCWVQIGDSYITNPGNGRGGERVDGGAPHRSGGDKTGAGLRAKNLALVPFRLALGLQADGWIVRSDCVWEKPNALPEPARDRPAHTHEYLFMLTRSDRYYWDGDAVRERTGREADPEVYAGAFGSNAGADADRFGRGYRKRSPALTHPLGRNCGSVWTIPTAPGLPGEHFACVDVDTEALTADGWKAQDDLIDGEQIATYNPETHQLTWAPATFHRYDYAGPLVAINKRDTSQLLTPNHRCLVRRTSGAQVVVRADQLKRGMSMPVAAPMDGHWTDIGVEWAALLGWYIAEGHSRYPGSICIYQSLSANPGKVERIRSLLSAVGADYSESIRERMWRGRPSLEITFRVRGNAAVHLQALAPKKRVTPTHMRLPRAERQALLDALIDGDGHRRADGRRCIVQRDKESIDAMQALAVTLGYRAHIGPRPDRLWVLYITQGEWLTLRGTNGTHLPIPQVDYRGVVWCPSVPTGFWLARREGKPFITGNTFPPALAERCILASTREGDVVYDPFAGGGTTLLAARRLGRRALGTELNPAYVEAARRRLIAAVGVEAERAAEVAGNAQLVLPGVA